MDNTAMHMDQYMHNAFWHEGQVCITFQLGPDILTIPLVSQEAVSAEKGSSRQPIQFAPTFDKNAAITSMHLEGFQNFFAEKYTFSSFKVADTLQSEGSTASDSDDINSEIGKYLFTSMDEQGRFVPTVISFFHFQQVGQTKASAIHTFIDLPSMFGMSSTGDDDDEPEDRNLDDSSQSHPEGPAKSPLIDLVKSINSCLEDLRNQGVPIVAASPVWLAGATSNGTSDPKPVGCPLTPPIPVTVDTACPSTPGLFPITLPELPPPLRPMSGEGVTVFILDTLPKAKEINRAVEGAEENNLLLLDVANNVRFHHNRLPDVLDVPSSLQPATGKDIDGKLIGFRMSDHGLFVAGIVRDVAPHARIECLRVLNDFCAGSLPTLTKALEGIQNRMLAVNPDVKNPDGTYARGDLVNMPVVVNMSLVIPPDNELTSHGFVASDLDNLRKDLLHAIQSLVNLGVVFVASAGNEGDLRYPPANPQGIRPETLYPAAFAYHGLKHPRMMIPVGAVNKKNDAASYSCYPGKFGIATYGGEVPKASKEKRDNCFTEAGDIDAPLGLYSALSYPALSVDDCEPTYPVPNANAWAYWVGTSFATPIITAIVARILEYMLRHSPPGTHPGPNTHVWHGITSFSARGRTVTWDRIGDASKTEIGPMILAVQKQCKEDEDDEDEEVEIEVVNVTINEISS